MSHLYLPWGGGSTRYTNRLQVRNQFASSLELHEQIYDYPEQQQRQRSPSLPPINTSTEQSKEEKSKGVINRNLTSGKRFPFYDEDGEGDTSGYGSETINRSLARDTSAVSPVVAWQQDTNVSRDKLPSSRGPDGTWSSRTEEGRPRWGDRGVATGRLWEPTAPDERLPQMPNQKKGTPSWVERGLNMIENTSEVFVIDQRSSTNSGFDCDRSSCNGSDEGRTFLRGQNVPIEPEVKAQRENKRLKALELQSAILSQLEDREKRRQEERERKLKEEQLEELRIQRQREEDRLKLEEERKINEEKQLLEQRKLDALKRALEEAEKKAKLDKEKRFVTYRQNVVSNTINDSTSPATLQSERIQDESNHNDDTTKSCSPTKSNRTYDVHSPRSQTFKAKDNNSQQTTGFNSPRSTGPSNLNFFIQNVPPMSLPDNQFSIIPIGINGELMNNVQGGLHLAVIVPQNVNNSLCNVSLNSLSNLQENFESGKILTPRKYRNGRNKDVSTQTESSFLKYFSNDKSIDTDYNGGNLDKDYQNIDENSPQESSHNILQKERRFRSEERYKKDLENRPKWGVNRPAAQYKKQSEKDPFYTQKRKLRQKHRPQPRQYISQSSDDSRSPSPPSRPERNNSKRRTSLSQSYWRNKKTNQEFVKVNNAIDTGNNTSTETNPLIDITVSENILDAKKFPVACKMSPTKRLTLSQKFINDKYGNRKLWNEDPATDRNLKLNNNFDTENRKKSIE
ncbi:hypothetical protein EVAR_43707_1 [Eumeta japonica]|uniref:CCDC66 domain-containing protein n=1 Tax=Eumeta variegata TaxID=151549 RepID=A0A4C1X0T3_EUMVA|nr:hypothetical protein EVAR_43707_1 [Eumeta japonica]